MADVIVQDARQINVTTTFVDNRLVLPVEGQSSGSVTDESHESVQPPAAMTLVVQNLASGAAVLPQWRPTGGTTWTAFTPTTGGVQATFRVPDVGSATSYDFAAEVSSDCTVTIRGSCSRRR